MSRTRYAVLILLALATSLAAQPPRFVSRSGHTLRSNGRPYYFVGTNYWYGGLLALEKNHRKGVDRLRKELDFLKANGVTNLRLMAGAEGSGLINGVVRVGPPLQPEQGKFDELVLQGLDRVLYEMAHRNMKGVIFLSNNWEWSGGFQQYLMWNGLVSEEFGTRKPNWDELRDIVSKFYTCEPCKAAYRKQVETVVARTNRFTGKRYIDDPTIMAWELANEPRPMRPAANNAYKKWIGHTAAFIRSIDKHHLITIGLEGWISTVDVELYEEINADHNIDYLTIHVWPKNWGWFREGKMGEDFPGILEQTTKYIGENVAIAMKLDKPLIIEEFGLPRDEQLFDPAWPTTFRDKFYAYVLSRIGGSPNKSEQIAGSNFWAFAGTGRPVKGQVLWKHGDPYTGDPPMEEQGLNSVFDSDQSTWQIIRAASRSISSTRR